MLSTGRLLTLTGPGGVGKTRLALRLAETVRDRFRDGVEVVELAALETGDLLEPTVAATLGLRDAGPDTATVLVDYLSSRRMLLVLDNCEHVHEVCARLVDRLLRAAPRLRILVTSRRTLGVYGEQVLAVPTLPVPEPGHGLRETARHDAVRLFVERAARILPGFSLHAGNKACVARLARRLEGIPLAIELAAARLRTSSLEDLARELDERLDVLAADAPAVLPRHRTLRATMDWSFGLCSAGERRLWSRLSMFPGGVDLHTAESVCAGDGIDDMEVLDLLAGLVDKSVVAGELREGGLRYRMLESLRAYGNERLPSPDRRLLRARYVRHYRDLAERHRLDRLVPDQLERYRLLHGELPNVRAALDACMGEPALAPLGLGTASAMWCYWLLAGSLTEGRYWLERGLRVVPDDTGARGHALWAYGLLALRQGDVAAAAPRLGECHVLACQAGNERILPRALMAEGVAAFSTGDRGHGLELLRESLELHRAMDDVDGVLYSLYFGAAYGSSEDPRQAAEFAEELLDLCERHHALVSRAYAQMSLGVARWNLGDCSRAEALVTAAIEFAGEIGDKWCLTQCLEVLAWVACVHGDHERSAELLGAAHVMWRAVGAAPERLSYHAGWHENCAEQTRRALGGRAFAEAFRAGERLGLDRAVAYATGRR
ncbi:LuxR family transcriptional regulator [Nonomuraea turkmeniaca]|uniref:LuxR family transcriptional regulator n=1 Tax=Nonomuraea turkmeniaca TaxID=103838 RepID=A0A5S4FX57_9ACTN|nr:AAA family ATPase [Nonomuraea turkmeniaca]TMR25276.1 LuxR family transcriptional regulator [Nonomuraea turkmeniaca]